MNQGISPYTPRDWNEARRRAETYLRALRGGLGLAEHQLLDQAFVAARARRGAHPVTLVMESLFALFPLEEAAAPAAMTPPMQRVTMLPEPTEFPVHDGLRRLFRSRLVPFAGAR